MFSKMVFFIIIATKQTMIRYTIFAKTKTFKSSCGFKKKSIVKLVTMAVIAYIIFAKTLVTFFIEAHLVKTDKIF